MKINKLNKWLGNFVKLLKYVIHRVATSIAKSLIFSTFTFSLFVKCTFEPVKLSWYRETPHIKVYRVYGATGQKR